MKFCQFLAGLHLHELSAPLLIRASYTNTSDEKFG